MKSNEAPTSGLTITDDEIVFKASNGFIVRVADNGGSPEECGRTEVVSPSGESMTLDLSNQNLGGNQVVSTVLFDDEMTLEYTLTSDAEAPSGHLWDSFKITQGGETLQADGIPSDVDAAAYELTEAQETAFGLLVETIETRHSKEFYEGAGVAYEELIEAMEEEELSIGCAVAIASYGIGVGGLIAACGATVGAGCVLALVGHELAMASVLGACGGLF